MKTDSIRSVHTIVALAIIAIGIVLSIAIIKAKPKIKKQKPRYYVPVVEVVKVSTGKHQVFVDGYGDVQPLHKVRVIPQVSGTLTYVSPVIVKGGRFKKGQILVKIDQRDYMLAVTMAEARLEDAKSKLLQLEQLASQARQEWFMTHTTEPPPLVAKEPQLQAAKAALEAAQAELDKAKLNLERTEIKAAFDGVVVDESVGKTQFVAPGQVLATLYPTSCAEIPVPLEKDDLKWIDVPSITDEEKCSKARVTADIAGKTCYWEGKVVRAEGAINPKTRMVNVVVRVDNPYNVYPPLAFGLFVKVSIFGHVLRHSAIIPRSALHMGSVWIFDKGKLRFRKVDVARSIGDKVIISSGLKDGDSVIISHLDAVTDGMSVRLYTRSGY